MFRGAADLNLDEKGRVAFHMSYRGEIMLK